jgi:hypothetical protein
LQLFADDIAEAAEPGEDMLSSTPGRLLCETGFVTELERTKIWLSVFVVASLLVGCASSDPGRPRFSGASIGINGAFSRQ